MTVFELYNLYIGDTLPDKKWSSCDIGPFQVEMVSNYDEVVKKLYHPAKKIVIGLDNEKTSYIEESKGEWVITAIANLSNSENTTKSILARYEIDDNGLWDLCTILTFLTGRPVVTSECLERYVLKSSCARACIDIETLIAAKLAWEHRSNLVSQELVYALLLYNEAITQGLIQILSYCYNTSLNILLDETNSKMHEVSSDIRQNLKKEIIKVIDSCNGLDITQKSAYNGLLSAKIDQGIESLHDKLQRMLLEEGIISDEDCAGDVINRIKYVNIVRNKFTHTGRFPKLKGLVQEQSDRYVSNIVAGVVPELCRLRLGSKLGFNRKSAGSLSQQVRDLTAFFYNGEWRGWKLETESFDDWFYND